MKKSSQLAQNILNKEIGSATESIGHRLNVIIDSMTDENCEPLPMTDKKLLEELKSLAMELYRLNDTTIPEATDDLVATIEAGW
jgi:hypothetical protein